MKAVNIFFIVLFVLSAALQYNDPDPYIWMPIYLYGAVLCYLSMRRRYYPNLIIGGIIAYAGYALLLFFDKNGVISWMSDHDAENIVQSMKATKPWIEETREFLGLLLLIIALVANLIWLRKSKGLGNLHSGISILLLTMLFGTPALAQEPLVKFNNPKSIHPPKGYSHSATIDLGTCRMVIVSGQVALDEQGNLVGKGDISRQAEQVFQNIKNAITATGGNMDHLVKLNYFLLLGQDIQPIRDVRDKFINTNTPPTSTLVKVSGLFREDILLEIEATFVIPKGK
jgi:enamine deaminase RidA (YjgF/YER057c/UK114 family)